MSEAVLDIRNLHKSFGEKVVHRGVSFQLQQGEILALLGGSGTGKSVILRSIIGLEHPDEGEIIFAGQDLTRLSERALMKIRQRIAYVFQNGALFDSLTVEENLSYSLREHTKLTEEQIHQKVNAMLELIDMSGSNSLLPAELSGGMQKRAGLARAIILDPEIILFDEPTAGLDPVNTRRLLDNIHKLKARGITGIFVTHDIPSALEIADRIAILYDGRIAVIDSVENIVRSTDPLVQSFVSGSAEHNPDHHLGTPTHA
ncbi:MAG TPA: ABC transporter ATP-binding protein [Bdellovibrionales bacterium]|nr:MAG: ABC transporter ATP-binding protein [Bdellovibrionales bacterium GWB1_52_6]OFZ04781.1 MAG: ABC transporter ATP-binding protein [Bdellovibrionales bacterium GWA1_52_35]OFZ40343.1 MAG: ABC transporter ATP-binding protein [Bdellovibrionales bacterium GWC1_52_8]HAR43356.1 ABC transporter ATP-binding protein [Bdellovibrionales bacterium]HCM39597.1 ABC transporter ATP-binding protein [Bdellovibrionales bacterium]